MNQKNFQFNKENCQSLQNGKILGSNSHTFSAKELSFNNGYLSSKDYSINEIKEIKEIKCTFDALPVVYDPNPQEVTPFQQSIFSYLQIKDSLSLVDPHYMNDQNDVNPKMRSILIDWLIDVHIKFKLLPQTIFMTVNLIDRYISKEKINRQQLQLVGITSLMIVCKYEEIYPPLLKDYMAVCDNAYNKQQILEMEGAMINKLNFEMTTISCYALLEHLQVRIKMESKAFVFSRYILENAMFDLNSLKYTKVVLVAGAIFLVNKIFKRGTWKMSCEQATGVQELIAKQCAKDLFNTMQKMEGVNLSALKRKFSTPENFEVSKYRIEKAKN